MIKIKDIKYITGKEINKLSPNQLDKYVDKGNKILQRNLKQYDKNLNVLGGNKARDYYSGMYEDMRQVMDEYKNALTVDDKRQLLARQKRLMNREYWTPTKAAKKLGELEKGAYGKAWKGFGSKTQSERAYIYENTGALFDEFNADEIERLESDEIVRIAAKYISKGLDYKETLKRAKRAVKYKLKKIQGENAKPAPVKPFSTFKGTLKSKK